MTSSPSERKKEINKQPLPKQSPDKKREAQIRSFFGQHFKKKIYAKHKEEIVQILLTATTKQKVNNELQKIYVNEQVSEILHIVKPLIQNLPGK